MKRNWLKPPKCQKKLEAPTNAQIAAMLAAAAEDNAPGTSEGHEDNVVLEESV
jgi:hypothetical protein